MSEDEVEGGKELPRKVIRGGSCLAALVVIHSFPPCRTLVR